MPSDEAETRKKKDYHAELCIPSTKRNFHTTKAVQARTERSNVREKISRADARICGNTTLIYQWASSVILIPEPYCLLNFCAEYRKLNDLSYKVHSPISRRDHCIDLLGNRNLVTAEDKLFLPSEKERNENKRKIRILRRF